MPSAGARRKGPYSSKLIFNFFSEVERTLRVELSIYNKCKEKVKIVNLSGQMIGDLKHDIVLKSNELFKKRVAELKLFGNKDNEWVNAIYQQLILRHKDEARIEKSFE